MHSSAVTNVDPDPLPWSCLCCGSEINLFQRGKHWRAANTAPIIRHFGYLAELELLAATAVPVHSWGHEQFRRVPSRYVTTKTYLCVLAGFFSISRKMIRTKKRGTLCLLETSAKIVVLWNNRHVLCPKWYAKHWKQWQWRWRPSRERFQKPY